MVIAVTKLLSKQPQVEVPWRFHFRVSYRVPESADRHLTQRLKNEYQSKAASARLWLDTSQKHFRLWTLCTLTVSLACLPPVNVLRVESSRQTVESVNLILSSRRTSAPLCERFTAPYVFSIQIYLVRGSVRPLRDP